MKKISHILFEVDEGAPDMDDDTARQKAEEAAVRAIDGEDFATLAREFSEDIGSAEQGGDLGWIEPGFMVQAFEDALYELSEENPVSEPIRTGFGWHVIYLREIRPSEGMTFAEAREILLQEYQAEADDRRFLEQADRLVDIIYEDPTTLDAAADELGLEVRTTEAFGRLGGPDGIAANPEVVRAAYSDLVLAQGSVSDPVDLGTNHIVMLLLNEHLPVALIPLEEVRDQVVQGLIEDQARDAAREQAEGLLAAINGGAVIAETAEAEQLEVISNEAAGRQSAELDRDLRQELFLLPRPAEGETIREIIEVADGYAVVQLNSVTDGVLGEDDEIKVLGYTRRISNGSATEEMTGFLKMLRAQSQIEIFEDRL